MKSASYTIPRNAKLPYAAGILALLLSIDYTYLMIDMPSYTKYFDYWGNLIAGVAMAVVCFFFVRRRATLLLIPAGIFAIVSCVSLSFSNWMKIALFFILLLFFLLRLPKWCEILFKILACAAACLAIGTKIPTIVDRVDHLAQTDSATASYLVPYLCSMASGFAISICLLLCILAMRRDDQIK